MRRMTGFLTALFLLLPVPARAIRVDLSQLTPEMRAVVVKNFPSVVDRDFSGSQIDEILKNLYKFPSVQRVSAVESGPESVRLEVQLFRRVGRIHFLGLKTMSESTARSAFGLSSGDPFEM